MNTYSDNFVKEFKNMIRGRKQQVDKRFPLNDLLIPNFGTLVVPREGYKMAVVRGLEEPYFSALNNTTVELVGRVKLYKRETLSDGTVRVNKDGEEVKKEVTVPQTSIAIISTINIKLPNFEIGEDGERRKVTISEGFKYVDYKLDEKGVKHYIYIIPRDYVYILDLNALVITPNKRRTYYKGYRFIMQDGNTIYIYVIPYKLRALTEVRTLGVKPSVDFNKEIALLVNHWINNKILFNPRLTSVSDYNLGYQEEQATLYVEDYVPYTHSVKEEKELDI